MIASWQPITSAPAERPFWALREHINEIHPAKLGTSVGMGDPRLQGFPDHRFVVHARTGQGFFSRWFREIEQPETAKNGDGEEKAARFP